MRDVYIFCIGKLKEKYWREAEAEYAKRLRAYCDLHIVELKDEQALESLSEAEKEKVKSVEGERILQKVRPDMHLIVLDIAGKTSDSVTFATHISKLRETGDGKIAFAIGGSLGLGKNLLERADETLSFSAFTFPHQLARVILLEQIYRGYRIMSGAPYHK